MRPRPGFGAALGITLRALVRNGWTCLLLAAPIGAIGGPAFAIVGAVAADPDIAQRSIADLGPLVMATFALLAGAGTLVLVFAFVYPLSMAGLVLVGARAVAGERTEGEVALARVAERGMPAVGAHLLTLGVVLAAPLAFALVAAVATLAGVPAAAAPAGLVALVALVWPGFVYLVRLALAVAVAVEEDVGPVRALARSAELVRGGFWWLAGFLALTALIGGVVASVLSAPFPLDGSFVLVAAGQGIGLTASAAVSGVAVGVAYAVRLAPPVAHDPVADAVSLGHGPDR